MLHILSVFLGYIEGRGKMPLLTDLANCELLDQFFTHKKVFLTNCSPNVSIPVLVCKSTVLYM